MRTNVFSVHNRKIREGWPRHMSSRVLLFINIEKGLQGCTPKCTSGTRSRAGIQGDFFPSLHFPIF